MSTATLSRKPKAGVQAIDPDVEVIQLAIDDALDIAELAVNKAIRVGQLLIEKKPALGHGNFQAYIEANFRRISYATAHRWMQAAERTVAAIELDATTLDVPVSLLLSAPASELSEPAREAQQLLLDFTKDKTIKDCLAAVVVDGDEPHRITRAANGKKLGGSKGEDRKDFPKFIGEKLSDVAAHLKSWPSYTAAQCEDTQAKFKSFLGKCPTPLLSHLKALIDKELKTR